MVCLFTYQSLYVLWYRPGGKAGRLNKTNSAPSALILSLDEAESGRAKAERGNTSSIETSLDGCQE